MNDENLKNGKKTQFNSETAAIAARKSVQVRKRKKLMAETATYLLSKRNKGDRLVEFETLQELPKVPLTGEELIVAKLLDMATKGNLKAAELLFRLRGGEFDSKDTERAARIARLKAETTVVGEMGKSGKGRVVILDDIPMDEDIPKED